MSCSKGQSQTLRNLDLTERPGQRITWAKHVRHGMQEGKIDLPPGATHAFSPGPHHGYYGYTVSGENMNVENLIAERGTTHGSFAENARISQATKELWRSGPGWTPLTEVQKEALDVIALKVSRILSGNHNEPDHWADCAGYATLAVKEIERF